MTVDVGKVLDDLGDKGPTTRQIMLATRQAGRKTFSLTVWMDSAHEVVELAQDPDIRNPVTGAVMERPVTSVFSGWGQPVDIQAPPADQVGDLPPNV